MSGAPDDAARRWRLGTRSSPLALAQAHETAERLAVSTGRPPKDFEVVPLSTKGDRVLDRPLSEIGGKGLFTKEVDAALLAGEVDLAVHSMKDVQTVLPEEISLAALLPREDPRDAFVSLTAETLADLPAGSVVGTASLRRQAQVRAQRPDLQVVIFRGNVQTRLRKLAAGEADATYLALAGLNRLGMADAARSVSDRRQMIPACAQGAIGITVRRDDVGAAALLSPLHCMETGWRVAAERSFLKLLDGDCRTPIAGHAELDGSTLLFRGEVLTPDGSDRRRTEIEGPCASDADAEAIGKRAAEEILATADAAFLEAALGERR